VDAFLLGGPLHGDIVEAVPSTEGLLPVSITHVQAETEVEMKQWAFLSNHGIAPPIGALKLLYLRLGEFIEPAIYIFAGLEGDPEVLTEDEAEETPDEGDPPSSSEG
jgi:hypothetical protein